jgi:hypothetical protein
MTRFTLADLILAVPLAAMTAYFVCVGINLRQRGFTAPKIAVVIGSVAILDLIACWAAIAGQRFRERWATARESAAVADQR